MRRTRLENHRFGESALLAEPVVGLAPQALDGVLGEELGPDSSFGGFLRDGLRAVLAELRHLAVTLRFGPRTTRTVETFTLVEQSQRLDRAPDTHLLDRA